MLMLALALGCVPARSASETPASGEAAVPRVRVLGNGPRLLLAQVRVPQGASFAVPTSTCQEVLAVVRRGTAALRGGRVLVPGRGVRFGPGGARLSNSSAQPLDLYVAVTRHVARRFGPDALFEMQRAPESTECGDAEDGLRESTPERTGPFPQAGGRLQVSLLLDEEGQGSRLASFSLLAAESSVGVPEHQHQESAEIVFIESGEGAMRVGDQTVTIRPGTFVYIPPRTPHDFRPTGTSPLRALQLYSPAGPEQRFRPEVDAAPSDGNWQGDEPSASSADPAPPSGTPAQPAPAGDSPPPAEGPAAP